MSPPAPASIPRRRLVGAGLTWLLAVVVAVAAAHPEGCHPPTVAEADAAVADAVAWLADNQRDDGRFLYRYDRDEARDLGGYNVVRHAGVLLALAQAAGAGVPGAEQAFSAGLAWADDQTEPAGRGRALAGSPVAETGATALLVAALVEWRRATGDGSRDDRLRAYGRYLEDTVTAEGAVVSQVDLSGATDRADARSRFATGETAWALARLHTAFPDEGWDRSARRVVRFLAESRDDVEDWFPPVSDHWAAYALAEIGTGWEERLDDGELALARRQAELFGLQVRYESQRRTEGIVRWTRGPTALGAGVGTLGEGLGALHRLAGPEPEVAAWGPALEERLRCVSGLLVDRQQDGAWYAGGVTQMDDQQHALSALLAARPVLADPPADDR